MTRSPPAPGEVVDVATKEIVGRLIDEHGVVVESEKMVEVHIGPDGRAVTVGD